MSLGGCQALTAHLSHNMPAQGQRRVNSPVCRSIQITGLWKHELRLGGLTLRKYPKAAAHKAVWTEVYWHPTLSAESLLRNISACRATWGKTHCPLGLWEA